MASTLVARQRPKAAVVMARHHRRPFARDPVRQAKRLRCCNYSWDAVASPSPLPSQNVTPCVCTAASILPLLCAPKPTRRSSTALYAIDGSGERSAANRPHRPVSVRRRTDELGSRGRGPVSHFYRHQGFTLCNQGFLLSPFSVSKQILQR